tara:strand:- start:324 stop:878 length:555 start_codon:yes stop_codon:yes gene_type:complete
MAITRLGPNNSTNISDINLTSQVTGTLPTGNGGTGATSFSPGKILQVISASDDSARTTTNTSSYSKASNTCDVTITPSSTSSKIFVQVCTGGGGNGGPNQRYFFTIYRDTTHIGASNGIRTHELYNSTGSGNYSMTENSINLAVMDSPNSTSALVYSVQAKGQSATTYLNNKGKMTLTCMEIAG